MSFRKLLIFCVFSGALYACSTSGQKFKHPGKTSDKVATIYVYRPFLTYNMAGWPDIYLNGEKKFSLKNNSYKVIQLLPGNHEIKAKGSKHLTNWFPKPVSIKYEFKAGEEYFVRVLPKFSESMSIGKAVSVNGSAQISIIPEQAALKEISRTEKVN